MPIFAISQKWQDFYRYKSQNRFQAGNAGKIFSHECEMRLPLSVLCSGCPIDMNKPHLLA
jgi:hypothetical protein